ncbi:MAG: energy-coupled thiamine transporter ThiT [Clostridia bacterium]|nr:energy-coupled thiamine transporter ThiT [Clostridia bacterium]
MKTKKLTLAGMLIALATVLSLIKIFDMPYGGSVTAGSMVPIIIFSMQCDTKWGITQAICYSIIQLMLGWYAPPAQNFVSFAAVILLDYVIAFGGLGLAGPIARRLGGGRSATAVGVILVLFIRFLCHFLSGILIWGSFAPEGQPVWLYSLLYNGGYMLGETVVTLAATLLLLSRKGQNCKNLPKSGV